jgi:hypothetical protein
VRQFPLRQSEGDGGDPESVAVSRGWFDGALECARILAERISVDVIIGGGFGGDWPVLAESEAIVAPGLPCVAHDKSVAGPDGEYRFDHSGVWREAVGVDTPFLTLHKTKSAPGRSFDLLWFGDTERFLVRNRCLEIEDLFGRLRVPATTSVLDRLLVRSRRLDDGVVSELPMAETSGPQTVTVRRSVSLSRDERWRDAVRFLSARAGVVGVKRTGDTIEVDLHDGARAIFWCDDGPDGWFLKLRGGAHIFTEIRLVRLESCLCAAATVAGEIDAMAPGMRGRLIFDLRADLIAVG